MQSEAPNAIEQPIIDVLLSRRSVPALLLGTHFFAPEEWRQARALLADGRRRVAAFRARGGEVEVYAEDPLRDL